MRLAFRADLIGQGRIFGEFTLGASNGAKHERRIPFRNQLKYLSDKHTALLFHGLAGPATFFQPLDLGFKTFQLLLGTRLYLTALFSQLCKTVLPGFPASLTLNVFCCFHFLSSTKNESPMLSATVVFWQLYIKKQ
ncbi:hypothetical protein [Thermithiobacillus plumbiphilus]|uniref:Uncharacterized protein n=1 Tax=Thermithiobacillus plumbiphilus TaxID=1729899 RepID=A0ABU9DA34_9PROT